MNSPQKIAVIGCGAWGTTLAIHLCNLGKKVNLWAHDEKLAQEIAAKKINSKYLPEITLPENINITADINEACKEAQATVIVVASAFYENICRKIPQKALENLVVSATKGLDVKQKITTSQIFKKIHPNHYNNFAVLSGPNLAGEISKGLPAASVVAAEKHETAVKAQKLLNGANLRIYTNTDVIGVELGGTLKNIMAIAAGIIDGLKFGDNAKAALLVRGAKEISRLGKAMGAKEETFAGLSGIGDLIATCSSPLSRNHTVGRKIASGEKLDQILSSMTAVAEGVPTTKAAFELARQLKIEMPIISEVYNILFKEKDPKKAVWDLMNRQPKPE